MTTKPYTDLLAQVEALAGATLATQERARVKIFANRRAKQAHRESPYWPRFLRVGEERVVSDTGLLPLAQTGLDTIDQIIRIHATDPFKSETANEYTEYYHDSTGIQITGYQLSEATNGADMIVTGSLNPDVTGTYSAGTPFEIGGESFSIYTNTGNTQYVLYPFPTGDPVTYVYWSLGVFGGADIWTGDDGLTANAITPDLATTWTPFDNATGTPTVTAETIYSAWITYLAAPADTYGDGDSEEEDVPEEWFEFMSQGAYCDWLRSDGQTEKALAEESIAQMLLGQQLEKVSRQNGNQVITRNLNHCNMQRR